jgi:hypothetical protein
MTERRGDHTVVAPLFFGDLPRDPALVVRGESLA